MGLTKWKIWPVVAALLLVAAFGVAACGDDDDDNGGGGGNAPGATKDSGDSGSSKGTGSDEQYVSAICKATLQFSEAMKKVTADPSKLSNPEDVTKALEKPVTDYAKAMSDAKPPKDLKEYHEKLVTQLNAASKGIKEGKGIEALSELGQADFPEPPKDVQDRLGKVAAKNDDCQKAGVNFEN